MSRKEVRGKWSELGDTKGRAHEKEERETEKGWGSWLPSHPLLHFAPLPSPPPPLSPSGPCVAAPPLPSPLLSLPPGPAPPHPQALLASSATKSALGCAANCARALEYALVGCWQMWRNATAKFKSHFLKQ
jgi:hypothetical protein